MKFKMKEGRGFKEEILEARVIGKYINGLRLEIHGEECIAIYDDIDIIEMSKAEKAAPMMI